jgi:DNA mismatch repair protein MutL
MGMSPEDLALCTLQHATSKLTSADDLEALTTLGFRGEALPSIAAVSHFSILSCLSGRHAPGEGDSQAHKIQIDGGEPERPEPFIAAGPHGTTVEVIDLFYNLPARKKFLKGQASEAAACTDTLLRAALTRPDVAFSFFQERREVFSVQAHIDCGLPSNPKSEIRNPQWISACLTRAREVLGRANSEGLLELRCDQSSLPELPPGYRLFGLLSPPSKTRPNRTQIYLTVNGRPVKDRTLTSALLEACRHLLPPKRYPIAVLYLELPPGDVDINVHPTKQEVRFRFSGQVYSLFHHAVRHAVGSAEGFIADRDGDSVSPSPSGLRIAELSQGRSESADTKPATSFSSAAKLDIPLGAPKPEVSGQRKFDLWSTVAPQISPAPAQTAAEAPARYVSPAAPASASQPAPAAPKEIRNPPVFGETESPPQSEIRNEPARNELASPFRVLGQAGASYIVIEDDSGVKLIDQHALHERILFEILLERASRHASGERQGLLTPEVLELTPVQAAVFSSDTSARELLTHLGFDVEAFGPRALAVRSIPAIFSSASKAALVADVLDAFGEGEGSSRAALREKAVYMMSCKGAIKAGERLSMDQMSALIEQFRRLCGGSGFTCPHGRPLAKEISWEELERSVGRR